MTEPIATADEAVLRRRRFLRGGALLAAAAGGAAVAGAGTALPASAATGASFVLGRENAADAATSLTVAAQDASATPALQLTNAKGPALLLTSVGEDFSGTLPIGAIVNTDVGPYLGVADGAGGSLTTSLATGVDLEFTPMAKPVNPYRAWDSKAKKGVVVARSSKGAIDSKGRLVKGSWVDLQIDSSDTDAFPIGAFLVLGSSGSSKDGYLLACSSEVFETKTISMSFLKGKTMSGSTLAPLDLHGTSFVVRVYASQTTYVTVDVTGFTVYGFAGPDYSDDRARAALKTRTVALSHARRLAR